MFHRIVVQWWCCCQIYHHDSTRLLQDHFNSNIWQTVINQAAECQHKHEGGFHASSRQLSLVDKNPLNKYHTASSNNNNNNNNNNGFV